MSPKDICLLFRFKDEETNIARFMSNNFTFCDCFIALDDRSKSADTYRKLSQHPQCAAVIRKNEYFTDMHDNLDKQALWSLLLTTGKTWALILDLDELLDQNFHREMVGGLEHPGKKTTFDNQCKMVLFPFVYMFPDENHCISLSSSNGVYGCRKSFFPCLFQVNYATCYPSHINYRLHIGRLPKEGIGNKTDALTEHYSPAYEAWSVVYHYSMVSPDLCNENYEFYQKYDPNRTYQNSYEHFLRKDYQVMDISPRIIG